MCRGGGDHPILTSGIINTYYTLHSDPSQDLEKQLGALSCSASQCLLSNGFHIRGDKFDKEKSTHCILLPMSFVWPLMSTWLESRLSHSGAQGQPSIISLISAQEDINTKHEADRYWPHLHTENNNATHANNSLSEELLLFVRYFLSCLL